MEVIGTCSLKNFIKINRDAQLKAYESAPDFPVNEIQEWAKNNHELFFDGDIEINFDNFEFDIQYSEGESNKKKFEDAKKIYSHANLIFFEILFLAVETQDDAYEKYLEFLNDVEELRFKKDRVEITICYESSYKGSEKLNIDFSKIAQDIEKCKTLYPGIEIYTRISMD